MILGIIIQHIVTLSKYGQSALNIRRLYAQISCDIRNFVGRTMAGRFKNVTTSEVNEVINNAVPENTKKATKFAVKICNGQCINFYRLHFRSRTGKLQLSKTIMQLFQPIFVSSRSLAKTLNEQ